jgi:hypothetical protein
VSTGLAESGIDSVTAGDPAAALEVLRTDKLGFDLILLDVMPIYRSLPGYRHDYLKFYQLPNSKSFPTICYFI